MQLAASAGHDGSVGATASGRTSTCPSRKATLATFRMWRNWVNAWNRPKVGSFTASGTGPTMASASWMVHGLPGEHVINAESEKRYVALVAGKKIIFLPPRA